MSDGFDERRAELIAAAVAGQLSPAERAELDSLRSSDSTIDAEIDSLGATAERIAGAGAWIGASPSDGLRSRIAAIGGLPSEERTLSAAGTPSEPGRGRAGARRGVSPTSRRRLHRPALLLLGAAACIAIGVVGGTLLPRGGAPAVTGPAGTLGALEAVDFVGEPVGVDIDADLVAHTWGTETVLAVDGLEVGADYTVVLTDRSGGRHASGSFIGAEATIDCALNAAILREDVAAVSILSADGAEVAVATVPPVVA